MNASAARRVPVFGALGILALAAGGVWLLRSFDPAQVTLVPACRFFALTGLQCPGCGMTRATHHLLNGRIEQALYFNVLYVATLPLMAAWGAWWVRRWWTGQPLARSAVRSNIILGGLLLAAWLGFWWVRNQPDWPLL
jgi:Protein of unknown function (DUF2752)